jgi:hypothetical protein
MCRHGETQKSISHNNLWAKNPVSQCVVYANEKKMSIDIRVENSTHCLKLLRDKNIEALGDEDVPPQTAHAFDRALEILVKLYTTRSDVAPPVTHIENDFSPTDIHVHESERLQ